jgi:hypothetical protein
VHVIDHPDARVLVDTGMTELHPAVADLAHRLGPLSEQAFDLAGIDIVVNTRLHFEHEPRRFTPSSGSRRRSPGLPGSAPDAVSQTLALTVYS